MSTMCSRVTLTRDLMKYNEYASMMAKMAKVHAEPITSSSVGKTRVMMRFHPKFATTATEMALPLQVCNKITDQD